MAAKKKKKKAAKKAKKKTSTAIAKRKSTSLSVAPKYIADGQAGKENIRREDLKLPFLRIGQSQTPLVRKGDVKEGHFFNSLTKKDYGAELHIIVCAMSTGRMRFGDFDEGGGIECQSPDGVHAAKMEGKNKSGKKTNVCADCTFSQWTPKKKGGDKPPECSEQGRYLVLVPGDEGPQMLVLQNTSFPAHRELVSMIHQSSKDSYGNLFLLKSEPKDNYRVMKVEAAGWPEERNYLKAKQLYDSFKKQFSRATVTEAE